MKKTFWKSKLLKFLVENKDVGPGVYELRRKMKVAFWFDGGLKVVANQNELVLNFRDPDLFILSTLKNNTNHIFRIPYTRLVCFEIIHEGAAKSDDPQNRFGSN